MFSKSLILIFAIVILQCAAIEGCRHKFRRTTTTTTPSPNKPQSTGGQSQPSGSSKPSNPNIPSDPNQPKDGDCGSTLPEVENAKTAFDGENKNSVIVTCNTGFVIRAEQNATSKTIACTNKAWETLPKCESE